MEVLPTIIGESSKMDPSIRHRIDAWLSYDPQARRQWECGLQAWDELEPSQPFHSLARAARRFYNGIDGLSFDDGSVRSIIPELFFAPRALAFAEALAWVDDDLARTGKSIPLAVERALRSIRQSFRAIIIRWGWEAIIDSRGFGMIADRLDIYRERFDFPYLRAIQTWRADLDEASHGYYDGMADIAKSLGLTPDPALSPAEAKNRAIELSQLRRSPVLGSIYPDRTYEEVSVWFSALCRLDEAIDEIEPKNNADRSDRLSSEADRGSNSHTSEVPHAPSGTASNLVQVDPIESHCSIRTTSSVSKPKESPSAFSLSLESRALGVFHALSGRGEWVTITRISELLDVNRTKLYRNMPLLRRVMEEYREGLSAQKLEMPRGSKNGKTGWVEAIDD